MITEHSTESTTTETSDKYRATGWRNGANFFSSDTTSFVTSPSMSNIHTYRVTVETADVRWAGTDAQVYVRLIGDITTAPEQHLAGGAFERGGVDQFTFDIPYIGNLVKIIVRHDGKGWGSAWMLERMVVKDENLQKTWVCNCSKWLNRDIENMVELTPSCTNSNSLSSFLQRRISGIFSSNSPAKNLFGSNNNQTNGKNSILKESFPKTFSPTTESPSQLDELGKANMERPLVHTPSNPPSPIEWQCNGSPIVIRFHVNYFTQESQYLYVCGSAKFLGEWNAQKALKMNMFTAPDGAWRGDWRLEIQVSEIEDFQYKYLVVDETNGNITWENGENRKMEFHRHTSQIMKVRDVWHTPSQSRKIITSFTPCDSAVTPKTVDDNATPCFHRQTASSLTDSKGKNMEMKVDSNRSREELIERVQQLQQQLEAKEAKLSHANALLLQKGISAVINRKDENSTWSRLTDFERENNELRSESETMKEKLKSYEQNLKILEKDTETLKLQFEEETKKKQELEQELVQLRQLQSKYENKSYTTKTSNIERDGTNDSIFAVKESVQLLSAAVEQVRSEILTSISQNEEQMNRDCQIFQRIIQENQQKVNDLKERWRKEYEWRRKLFNQVQELKGNIRVFCRPRPSRFTCAIQVLQDNRLMAKGKIYEFDKVFYPNASQTEVYEETSSLITSVMDGYNVCLFAYGQTGSGKTYTMNGDENNRGVNYRAIEELIRIRDERAEEIQYEIEMSLVEIYNEQLHDLISGSDESSQSIHSSSSSRGSNTWTNQKLEIKLGPQGPYIPELTWIPVISVEQTWQVMEQASNYRSQGKTTMNDRSSRSHLVISLRIQGRNLINETKLSGKLHLVDLAGSERISRSEATGDRLKEAQHINKSLSCLGDVFMNLLSKNSHIPYRNSKLTFLLQDSLGGDSKTLMFVNVSPEEQDLQESISSLNFASRVNRIQLGPATKHAESQELSRFAKAASKAYEEASSKEEEIRFLKQKLNETTQSLHEKDIQLEKWREQLQQEAEHKQRITEEYKRKEKELDTSRQSLQKLEKQLSEWRELLALEQTKKEESKLHTSRSTPVRKRSSPHRVFSPYRTGTRLEPSQETVSKENRFPLTEKTDNQTEMESSSSWKTAETPVDAEKEASATPKPQRKVKHRVHFEEPVKTSSSSQTGSCIPSKQAPKKVIYAFGSRLEVPLESKKKGLSQPCSSLKRPAGRVLSHKTTMDK